MQYLSFKRYVLEMGGILPKFAFDRFEMIARMDVDRFTFGRIKNEFDGTQDYTEPLQYLMFELVNINSFDDFGQSGNTGDNRVISSQSNDGVSESYEDIDKKDTAEYSIKKNELIRTFLRGYNNSQGIPLLYTGIVRGRC